MKRLERHEKVNLEARLCRWQTPQDMQALVADAMDCLGSSNLFNQTGLAFLRDAWIAAEFGLSWNAETARLVTENWPDFELSAGGKVQAFEAVEADDPMRRRGDEYRYGVGEVEDDPIEDWIFRSEQAPCWIEAACRKKLAKRYAGDASLVIYLNMNEYGIRQVEVEACFASATDSAKNHFESVWILWKSRGYQVWSPAT